MHHTKSGRDLNTPSRAQQPLLLSVALNHPQATQRSSCSASDASAQETTRFPHPLSQPRVITSTLTSASCSSQKRKPLYFVNMCAGFCKPTIFVIRNLQSTACGNRRHWSLMSRRRPELRLDGKDFAPLESVAISTDEVPDCYGERFSLPSAFRVLLTHHHPLRSTSPLKISVRVSPGSWSKDSQVMLSLPTQ